LKKLFIAMLDEILEVDLGPRRKRKVKRGVKRKQSKYPVRRRDEKCRKVSPPTIEIKRPDGSK
jgi:hypothetical protein